MVASTQNRSHLTCYHEPMDQSGNIPSVSPLFPLRILVLTTWKTFSVGPLLDEHIRINEIFDAFGPIPRLCIEYRSDESIDEYEDDLQRAILNVTASQLEQLLKDATSLTMDAVSHKICLLSRERRDDVHSRPVVAPITPSIQSRLANQLRNLEQGEKIRLYKNFARVSDSRATAGVVFEAIVQCYFQEEINLDLIPMVKLDKVQKGALPQWYSSHVPLDNPVLEASRRQVLQQGLKIAATPARTKEFPEKEPLRIEPNVFYVPEAGNHESLDSFILINGLLLIFQFTISRGHDIKPGLLRFFKRCPNCPPISDWCFVFVIPRNLTLTCPQPWRLELRKVSLFSAVVDTSGW